MDTSDTSDTPIPPRHFASITMRCGIFTRGSRVVSVDADGSIVTYERERQSTQEGAP